MSDGPWKSLQMRPHWKQVAKRAENGAFSIAELSGALEVAVLKEAEELPLEAVCRAVVPSDQGVLFGPDLDGKLEALRRDHPGSKLMQMFLSCLRDQNASGSSGHDMVERALADTLTECTLDHSRPIQEHCYRKRSSSTVPVARRLAAARHRCDFRGLASRVVASSGSSASSPGPAMRSGFDDGPML